MEEKEKDSAARDSVTLKLSSPFLFSFPSLSLSPTHGIGAFSLSHSLSFCTVPTFFNLVKGTTSSFSLSMAPPITCLYFFFLF